MVVASPRDRVKQPGLWTTWQGSQPVVLGTGTRGEYALCHQCTRQVPVGSETTLSTEMQAVLAES